MKIKHQEFKIEAGKPFANCKLGREKYAEVLTQVVETYADGMVLAVDNAWGTGKTTFVKMWQQYLEDRKFRTVYFNAWENDFDANALVAILAELKPLTGAGTELIFKTVMHKAAVLSKNLLPGLLKALAARYVDLKELQDVMENTAKGVTEIFEKEIDEYASKKETIEEFRQVLEKFIKIEDGGKPLVFFVDELDRCRPSYAVEVLEQLKHLFSVPGIVFVLSIDKEQLAHAVRGFYGSDLINSDEYLRRFIDLEYSIPKPTTDVFFLYLYDYYGFDEYFEALKRKKNDKASREPSDLKGFASIMLRNSTASLRQLEKILGALRLLFLSFQETAYTYPALLFYLIYQKVLDPKYYEKIKTINCNVDDLSDKFSKSVFTHGMKDFPTYVLSLLIHAYWKETWIKREVDNRVTLEHFFSGIIPMFTQTFSKSEVERCIEEIRLDPYDSIRPLSDFTNRIDLLEPLFKSNNP